MLLKEKNRSSTQVTTISFETIKILINSMITSSEKKEKTMFSTCLERTENHRMMSLFDLSLLICI